MADPTVYGGTPLDTTPSNGGAVAVTIANYVGRGNGGTSIPCRRCKVQAAISNAGYCVVNINAAATSILGIIVPGSIGGGTITAVISTIPTPHLELEIDDVNKLYFWDGTNGDIVNILYTK